MNSPRKSAAPMASPRGGGSEAKNKVDSSQLTPRQRRQVDTQHSTPTGRQQQFGISTTLLPNKMIPSSVTTLGQLSINKPKAAPRSPFEIDEELLEEKRKAAAASSQPKDGGRGSGDALLRVPLEGLSKLEIKNELKQSPKPLSVGFNIADDDDNEDEKEEQLEEDEKNVVGAYDGPDRARFNVWNGKNYDLHLLGNFKDDFQKRVKSFQRPKTEPIVLDPFCRDESGLVDEPTRSDAFLIWKSKNSDAKWPIMKEGEGVISSPFLVSSSEGSSNSNNDEISDTDSLPDPDITEYITTQQQKREEGLSATGETLYYDEDYEMVRNLHRDSHSLTNYGVMPDDKWIGKAHLFYPEMTEAEKKMLKAQDPSPKKKLTISNLSPRIAVVRRAHKT